MFGIPAERFFEVFTEAYQPERGWRIIVAEGRPRERETAAVLKRLLALGYQAALISDNMMAYCIKEKRVETVFIFSWKTEGEFAVCQSGSLLAAVLAHEMNIPCYLGAGNPPLKGQEDGHRFVGKDILPPGVKSFIPLQEKVPLHYVSEQLNGKGAGA